MKWRNYPLWIRWLGLSDNDHKRLAMRPKGYLGWKQSYLDGEALDEDQFLQQQKEHRGVKDTKNSSSANQERERAGETASRDEAGTERGAQVEHGGADRCGQGSAVHEKETGEGGRGFWLLANIAQEQGSRGGDTELHTPSERRYTHSVHTARQDTPPISR
ncbi:hypothetical protein GJAV_G00270460 [Gymnothorax javanicus]|nr:hypothetical protein GJAV_G00270460 [Gymnothorax javanicus]